MPFLNEENLCEIHLQLGEAATSVTCRSHPRFIEDYGPFREITLTAACPAPNELLLGSRERLTFPSWEDEEPEEPGGPWLEGLMALRTRMLSILTDRQESLRRRLTDFLLLAWQAQALLDEAQGEALGDLARTWEPQALDCGAGPGLFPGALRALGELEVLEEDWRTLLRRGEETAPVRGDEALLERVACYFAFRHLLKAINVPEICWAGAAAVRAGGADRGASDAGVRRTGGGAAPLLPGGGAQRGESGGAAGGLLAAGGAVSGVLFPGIVSTIKRQLSIMTK